MKYMFTILQRELNTGSFDISADQKFVFLPYDVQGVSSVTTR